MLPGPTLLHIASINCAAGESKHVLPKSPSYDSTSMVSLPRISLKKLDRRPPSHTT